MAYTIGQLAKAANVKASTIRFYERKGVLTSPGRSPGGYRLYSSTELDKLHFIKHAQALGFTLSEVQELLILQNDAMSQPDYCCSSVKKRTEKKLTSVENKIQALTRIKQALQQLYDQCQASKPIKDCPILAALATTDKSHES